MSYDPRHEAGYVRRAFALFLVVAVAGVALLLWWGLR